MPVRKKTHTLKKIALGAALLIIAILCIIVFFHKNLTADIFSSMPFATTITTVATDNEAAYDPLKKVTLYVDPRSPAALQATAWQQAAPQQATKMAKLAALPSAKWLASSSGIAKLPTYLASTKAASATATLVIYNLPERDCGDYSSGGAKSAADYRQFIDVIAGDIADQSAIVILEPDALAGIECLSVNDQTMYYKLLASAVKTFKKLPNVTLYIDAGNSSWVKDTAVISDRLTRAGVASADGFSLNISNFQPTEQITAYGKNISEKIGDKHFIIDTSRNGNGAYKNPKHSSFSWCNPPGRALGRVPTVETDNNLVDAYLYIKYPGESDGIDSDPYKCFNGPPAGTWWPDYALGLIERWPQELQK